MVPLIIAHRGGAPEVGENTAAAFDIGLAGGADMLEMDVQRTADGALIVLHDDIIVTGDGLRRRVDHMTLEEVRSKFPRLLLLDEFLEHYARHKRTNVDVKAPGFERELVDRLREHDLARQVLISATSGRSLRTIRILAPETICGLSRGQIVSWLGREPHSEVAARTLRLTLPVQLVAHARFALSRAVMLQYRLIRPWLVRYLNARGLQVYCWTVNDPAIAVELAASGVDGIASDFPERLISVLRS